MWLKPKKFYLMIFAKDPTILVNYKLRGKKIEENYDPFKVHDILSASKKLNMK